MSTDLDLTQELVNPITGEVLALSGRTEDLARLIADVREAESQLREMKNVAGREVLRRMDMQARWTMNLGDVEIEGESPALGVSKEWDGAGLHAALWARHDDGLLGPDAINAAVEIQHEYKVKQVGVNALRKAGLSELVDQFVIEIPRERRIKKVKVR